MLDIRRKQLSLLLIFFQESSILKSPSTFHNSASRRSIYSRAPTQSPMEAAVEYGGVVMGVMTVMVPRT